MRVPAGRIALLLGVAALVATTWYGAVLVLDDPEQDGSHSDRRVDTTCNAATKRDAREAARQLVREYGDEEWFAGIGTSHTDALGKLTEMGQGVIDISLPRIDDDGWFVLISYVAAADVSGIPPCLGGVPVVAMGNGPYVAD